jgi:hypothetical protein
MADWFRGEVEGGGVAPPGKMVHDFGDGVYFTDRLDVAMQYAETRPGTKESRRVYKVDLDTRTMRVLDLEQDPRWQKFLKPFPNLPSPEASWASGNNESYGQSFKQFVKQNNINLDEYDAVVGREYVRGGRQIAILHKNGRMSPLAAATRAKMLPIPTRVSSMPARWWSARGRIGTGLKVVGGTAAMIGLQFLVDWIWGKIMDKMLEEEMRRLQPEVDAAFRTVVVDAAELLANGKPAFAIVTVEIKSGSMRSVEGGDFPLPPKLRLVSLSIGPAAVKSEGPVATERTFRAQVDTREVVYSFGADLPQDAVELYKLFRAELQWFDQQLAAPGVSDQDASRLFGDREKLLVRYRDALQTR